MEESGAEWDPDGRAAVPHTHCPGTDTAWLPPYHSHTHLLFNFLTLSFFHNHFLNLFYLTSCIFLCSPTNPAPCLALSTSLFYSLLSVFIFPPPPPSPSVVTFRTSSSMRSSGRVEHYNNSLHRKLINLPDNVFIQKLKVEGYRTRSGVIDQSQAPLYGLECPVMA